MAPLFLVICPPDLGIRCFPGEWPGLQVLCQRSADRRPSDTAGERKPDGFYLTCIRTEQRSVQPSAALTRRERSSSRPAIYGPRSTTGTVMVFAPCVSV